jgi:chromosomal replication initiation ATPase DnaA
MKNLYRRAVHLCGQDAVNKALAELVEAEQRRRVEKVASEINFRVVRDIYDLADWLKFHGKKPEDILQKTRNPQLVRLRRALCYYLSSICNYNLEAVAEILNYDDHTTVLYHRRKFEDFLDIDDPDSVYLFSTLVKQNKPEGV